MLNRKRRWSHSTTRQAVQQRKTKWLEAYKRFLRITDASCAAGVTRQCAWQWLQNDPEFRAQKEAINAAWLEFQQTKQREKRQWRRRAFRIFADIEHGKRLRTCDVHYLVNTALDHFLQQEGRREFEAYLQQGE
jgi:hypothetical protein